MSRICELSGVGVQFGHKVSHSQRKTNRKFLPNLQTARLLSDVLKANFTFRITASMMKSIEIKGGLDSYLMLANNNILSLNALRVKRKIQNAISESNLTEAV